MLTKHSLRVIGLFTAIIGVGLLSLVYIDSLKSKAPVQKKSTTASGVLPPPVHNANAKGR